MRTGIHKIPTQWNKATPYTKDKYLEEFYEYRNYSTGPDALDVEKINVHEAVKFILGVNAHNCVKLVSALARARV